MSETIKKDTTSVTRYIKLVDSATGVPKTALTITDIDLQYTRNRTAPAAKIDATALATTSTAYTSGKAIEVDASFSPGLYRIDWPDAAFATGVDKVILCVTCTGVDPAYEEIALVDNLPGELTTATMNALVDLVWDEALAGHASAGSAGLGLSNAATAPNAATIADAVWDESLAGHAIVGSTGEALAATVAIGDPWSTTLPGAYTADQAGAIIGGKLDIEVSSRASGTTAAAIKTKTDSLTFSVAGQVDSNIQYVNDTQVQGTGAGGNEWRPV
jgi:hypothetical protein